MIPHLDATFFSKKWLELRKKTQQNKNHSSKAEANSLISIWLKTHISILTVVNYQATPQLQVFCEELEVSNWRKLHRFSSFSY